MKRFNEIVNEHRINILNYCEEKTMKLNGGKEIFITYVGTANKIIPPSKKIMKIIFSCNDYWEHVSVSYSNRVPNWGEMCIIKNVFWEENEVVMQLHPAKENYVNNNSNVLHLWRPGNMNMVDKIPLPPIEMV
jgi:hypothetical protein